MGIGSKLKGGLKEKFFLDSFKVMVLRVSGSGFQFLALFFLTNFASEVLVGKYSYLNSMAILIGSLALFGMNSSFLQFIGKFKASGDETGIVRLTKKKYVIVFLGYILFLTVYIILSRILKISFFDEERIVIFDKIALVIFPFSCTMLNLEVLRGLDRLIYSEMYRNIFRYGGLLVLISLLLITDSIHLILNGYVVLFYILFITSTFVIINQFRKKHSLFQKVKDWNIKEILKISFPMSFAFVSLLIMQSFDVFMLERYYSFETVAYYGVAIKISTIISIVLSSINATIAPKISGLFFSNKKTELNSVIKRGVTINFIFTTPLILLMLVFSKFILSFFGQNYVLASTAMVLILIGQMFNAFCGPVGLYFNMTGRQNKFRNIIFLSLIVNLCLNLVFVPRYGMVGAAFSTAFSYALWNILGVILIYRLDKINITVLSILNRKTD